MAFKLGQIVFSSHVSLGPQGLSGVGQMFSGLVEITRVLEIHPEFRACLENPA